MVHSSAVWKKNGFISKQKVRKLKEIKKIKQGREN